MKNHFYTIMRKQIKRLVKFEKTKVIKIKEKEDLKNTKYMIEYLDK